MSALHAQVVQDFEPKREKYGDGQDDQIHILKIRHSPLTMSINTAKQCISSEKPGDAF